MFYQKNMPTQENMNTVKEFNKHTRRLKALAYGLKYPKLARKMIRNSVSFLFEEGSLKRASIPKISAEELLKANTEIKLSNFNVREGNVSPLELMIISSLVASRNPTNLLEIGTFDGNTTLQMALNCSPGATIHTIDLGENQITTELPIWEEDLKFVKDEKKIVRKFTSSPLREKIVQHIGDSNAYDFSKFTKKAKVDFCFIDGGHSYACVKRDTEKALAILGENGILLWHDFNPNCPGVYRYLLEVSKTLPLRQIEGTVLVMCEKPPS